MTFRKQYLLTLSWIVFLMILALLTPNPAFACGAFSGFGGTAVSNSINDEHSSAWGFEQSVCHSRWSASFGYLNEGHRPGTKRDGVFALAAFSHSMTPRFQTQALVGPYLSADTQVVTDHTYRDVYRLDLIGGGALSYSLSNEWTLSGRWLHVMSFIDRDSDVFLIGLGFKP